MKNRRTLHKEFEKEIGIKWFAFKPEINWRYIKWLEDKLLKIYNEPDGWSVK